MVDGRFADDLKRVAVKIKGVTKDVVNSSIELTAESVVNGSSFTGSAGQPADLREGAWTTERPSDWEAIISTSDKSARSVEDGISYKFGKPLTKLKSVVGGFHSVLLTVDGFQRLVDEAVRKNA